MDSPIALPRSLERIIVVPRNGYANRLQAWASSAILASQLDVPLEVAWEPESIAPVGAGSLFATDTSHEMFLSAQELHERIGADHHSLARYLHVNAVTRVVTLAGHDRGEQAFMPDLLTALEHDCEPTTLLIIAGGKFHIPGTSNVTFLRRDFYRSLPWAHTIEERTSQIVAGRTTFIGLHIRETDRSVTAPTPAAIRSALDDLAARTGLRSVFIAGDTERARRHWSGEAERMGLDPWQAPNPDLDRSSAASGVDALVDWRILGLADALVYSQDSTFGEEATVAGGSTGRSMPLHASTMRQASRRAAALAKLTMTYPLRHWGQGRKPS